MISHSLYVPLFESDSEDYESLENYRRGGFHPVSLGDRFYDGRYTIMHKLGFGTTSMVWLARDRDSKQFVCLKIRIADSCLHEQNYESAIHQQLGGWLHEFEHHGPNGTHRCVVSEVIGPSLAMVERIEQSEAGMGEIALLVKRGVAACLAQAVAAMHARGIVHGGMSSVFLCPKGMY
jgi:serine/threonine-protein kinase SRPK3